MLHITVSKGINGSCIDDCQIYNGYTPFNDTTVLYIS